MDTNSWQNAGEQIKKLVQDAVEQQDFSRLGETISDVVNDTVNEFQASLKENLGRGGDGWRSGSRRTYRSSEPYADFKETYQSSDQRREERETGGASGRYDDAERIYQSTNREAADRIRRDMQEKKKKSKNPSTQLIVPGEISGNVMKWTGYSVGGACGLAVGILGVVGLAVGLVPPVLVPAGILAIVFAGGMALGRSGSAKVKLAKRFRRYCSVLGDRTYCLVEELAAAAGQSTKAVRKDLKKMIDRGYFKEGYLDGKETLLITDKETYQQYLSAQTEYERRRVMDEQAASERRSGSSQGYGGQGVSGSSQSYGGQGVSGSGQGYGGQGVSGSGQGYGGQGASGSSQGYGNQGASGSSQGQASQSASGATGSHETADDWGNLSNVSQECREIVEEGLRYVRHIRECNDRLPGEEISEKLDRLELVVTRIFREVAKNPDNAGDLKKMMSYYLPTTSKLLDAYCELDGQPVKGQNIEGTKQEIESALDTINTAFENLLDSMFQDAAWDISSDISVLNTMLAQEGLTGGNDFSNAL